MPILSRSRSTSPPEAATPPTPESSGQVNTSTRPWKVIVIGDSNVGKTNLLTRYCHGAFSDTSRPTVGVDFFHHKWAVDDSEDAGSPRVGIELWDTAGQERASALSSTVYRHVDGALVVFDLTRRDSFEHIPRWVESVLAHVKGSGSGQQSGDSAAAVPMVLVGNKADLTHLRCVGDDEAEMLCNQLGMVDYVQTSSYSGDGVTDAFCELFGSVLETQRRRALELGSADGPGSSNSESLSLRRIPSSFGKRLKNALSSKKTPRGGGGGETGTPPTSVEVQKESSVPDSNSTTPAERKSRLRQQCKGCAT